MSPRTGDLLPNEALPCRLVRKERDKRDAGEHSQKLEEVRADVWDCHPIFRHLAHIIDNLNDMPGSVT